METVNAIGRRKSAIARVYINEGKGKITVNDRAFEEYFPLQQTQNIIQQPINLAEASNKYDIVVNLKGGGTTGQAEALRLALARAMVKIKPESKEALKAVKLMTRDSREVERKKPGQPGARKRFQFSKR
ncbi:MAG: 30S ribosomal protein S9 [Bacteroidetes bacterium RBG_13_46_8]|nr:MAG: 30S ribosomal protein S9 [Bacteroidetes bacterium RBG_13_46_8]